MSAHLSFFFIRADMFSGPSIESFVFGPGPTDYCRLHKSFSTARRASSCDGRNPMPGAKVMAAERKVGKVRWFSGSSTCQRLTFPFPFVHHQPHRLESGTTVGKENSCHRPKSEFSFTVVNHFPFLHSTNGSTVFFLIGRLLAAGKRKQRSMVEL
jgi:hypothetical protein